MKNLFKISLLFFIIICLFSSYSVSSLPPMENIRFETFEYNNYAPFNGWETSPAFMVDYLSGTVASTTIDGDNELVYSYFTPDGNYILKVEVRIFAFHYLYPPTPYDIILTPIFGYIPLVDNGQEGDDHRYVTLTYDPQGHPTSPWYDITNDTNAPNPWTHNDIYRLAVNVTADLAIGNTLYATDVMIRVKIADYKKYPLVFVNEKYTPFKHLFDELFFNNISSALEHVMTDGYVIVFKGTYNESIEVPVDRGCKIIGQSRYNTFIDGKEDTKGTGVVTTYADNLFLKNFNITGSEIGSAYSGIRIRGSSATIMSCDVWNNSGRGIDVQGSNCNISHCRLLSNKYEGIRITDGDDNNIIYNNKILNNGILASSTGSLFIDSSCINNTISHNTIYPNKYPAIYINNANYNYITSNEIYCNDNFGSIGVDISDSEYCDIYNNNITGGLCINVDKNLVHSNIRYNNIISNSSGICLYGNGINNSYIYNNQFLNAYYGIYLSNSFTSSYMYNSMYGCDYGMYIE